MFRITHSNASPGESVPFRLTQTFPTLGALLQALYIEGAEWVVVRTLQAVDEARRMQIGMDPVGLLREFNPAVYIEDDAGRAAESGAIPRHLANGLGIEALVEGIWYPVGVSTMVHQRMTTDVQTAL